MITLTRSNGTTTIRRLLAGLAATLFMTGAAVIAVQAPAMAAYDSVKIYAPHRSTATSARRPVEAHNSQHWVQVRSHAASSLLLVVKNIDSGKTVLSQIPNHSNWITIYDQYGENYRLEATGITNGGNATIRNCTSDCKHY